MIYISEHTPQLITVNGTTETDFSFTNNQTQQEYKLDLWTVGITPISARKQISFLLQWNDTTANPPTSVNDGINYINVPSGEYNFKVGEVCGLMILKGTPAPATYDNKTNNIVYNG